VYPLTLHSGSNKYISSFLAKSAKRWTQSEGSLADCSTQQEQRRRSHV